MIDKKIEADILEQINTARVTLNSISLALNDPAYHDFIRNGEVAVTHVLGRAFHQEYKLYKESILETVNHDINNIANRIEDLSINAFDHNKLSATDKATMKALHDDIYNFTINDERDLKALFGAEHITVEQDGMKVLHQYGQALLHDTAPNVAWSSNDFNNHLHLFNVALTHVAESENNFIVKINS